MSVQTDPLNATFRLHVALYGLDAPLGMAVDQDPDGVRVHVTLAEPAQVHAWAAQMGTVAETGQPAQINGRGWWYRHTNAVVKRDGLRIEVAAVQVAQDPDAAQMTGPVTA